MHFFKSLMFQIRNNYYIKLVTVFFSIITISLLFLMFIFSWHQNQINNKEVLDFDSNSFSRFTQILEKKVLSDVYNVMYKSISDIKSFDTLSDYDATNPFISSTNPFDTTLMYKKRLYQLQQFYPYIASIDLYSYKFDTYISSSGSVFYNALKRRNELDNMVPYHILDIIKVSDSDQMWISPALNNTFAPFTGLTSFIQMQPLFSSSGSKDLVCIITIDPSVIYNDYFKNQLPKNSYFYILNHDKNIILKTSPDEYLISALNKDTLSEEIQKNLTGTNKFIYDKSEYNIIWQTSSINNWKYIYLSKRQSPLIQLSSSLHFVFTWFVIVFIVCLVVTLIVSKKIYKPMDVLLKYTKSVLGNSNNIKNVHFDDNGDIEEVTDVFASINNQLIYYKDTINKNSSLLLNNIAINLLDRNVKDIEELNSWLSILNISFEHNAFFLFIIKIDPEIYENLDNQKRDFFLLYIQEQMEVYYAKQSTNALKFISCYRQDGVMPFIINFNEELYSKEKDVASIILSNMNDEISRYISIAISDPITDLSKFNSQYKETLNYFKYVFIYGNKNIFDRNKVNKFDSNNDIYDSAFKRNLKTILKLSKFDEVKIELAEFYKQAKSKDYSYRYLQTFSSEIISIITNEFQNNDIDLPRFQDGDLMLSFSKLPNIERCAEWFDKIINTYAEAMQTKSLNMDSKYIRDILKYIDEDIVNVTLNSVSDKFKMSAAHFSRMFKKHTGTNFLDYVIEKRLEHACHLIASTDMKISDIGSMLGYLNINYFNKIFKLKYSVTPTQYRKQSQVLDKNLPSK